jgi:sugar lactone lactonase YvrE
METTIITTIAGRATPGFDPDITDALAARLHSPHDVAVGPDGVVYIADAGNHCVRAWSPDGTLSTVAGRCGESGFAGDGADATDALLYGPGGVGVSADGALWIADTYNHLVRRVVLQKTR